MLFAFDLYKEFIDVEGVAVASMFSLEAPGAEGTEFDTPDANCFSGYGNASPGQ